MSVQTDVYRAAFALLEALEPTWPAGGRAPGESVGDAAEVLAIALKDAHAEDAIAREEGDR